MLQYVVSFALPFFSEEINQSGLQPKARRGESERVALEASKEGLLPSAFLSFPGIFEAQHGLKLQGQCCGFWELSAWDF